MRLPKDCALFVGVEEEVVNPVMVRFEVAPQVAKGTGGAPVVAPLELQLEPLAKTNVAAEPTKLLPAAPRLTMPVLVTVTTVPVPPVVVRVLLVLPPNVRVPAILPIIAVPVENAMAAACVALFKIKALPEGTLSSSPTEPVKVRVLVVVVEDSIFKAVLFVICKAPNDWLAAIEIVMPPAVLAVPMPSTIKISVDDGVVRVLPVPSAAVFQLAAVEKSLPVAAPT